jgi:hypothetical protein
MFVTLCYISLFGGKVYIGKAGSSTWYPGMYFAAQQQQQRSSSSAAAAVPQQAGQQVSAQAGTAGL